jgi:hypothetical protein
MKWCDNYKYLLYELVIIQSQSTKITNTWQTNCRSQKSNKETADWQNQPQTNNQVNARNTILTLCPQTQKGTHTSTTCPTPTCVRWN